ncbi:MAG: alpha/beta fold hydrolase [Candidatus Palauibacterales bacterium]|nr:alpha/beta fold hydrolase [Candidatus Palauibacterales bacterium]MDP2530261.1 alpha/beta fold hydrolase [Candidatus Palauibacterales bacterium]MDP2583046.1 alpha/beta fold hydrolase [Candidatus Palauibacterales bacterium]
MSDRRGSGGQPAPGNAEDRGREAAAPRIGAAAASSYRPLPFRPAPWLPGPHAQTLAGRLLRRPGATPYRRERLQTPDGDFLDLDRLRDAPAAFDVLVLHGLEGSSASGYVREAVVRLRERGLHAAGLNFRSCSGEPNRARRFYHAGETGDLSFVLERIVERRRGRPVGLVGFSLGANVLLRYLEERGAAARELVRAAVAISVPFDLSGAADRMERVPGRLYGATFLRSLRRSVEAKARRRDLELPLAAVRAARTLRQFDRALTAPLHGFESVEAYYARSSSGRALDRVRVPTLVIQALDDPFLPAGAVPAPALFDNPWIHPVLHERGGHVGFVEGRTPWSARFWAELEAARFLSCPPALSMSGCSGPDA